MLLNEVVELPNEQENNEIESRMFDLTDVTTLYMQLALIEADIGVFDRLCKR